MDLVHFLHALRIEKPGPEHKASQEIFANPKGAKHKRLGDNRSKAISTVAEDGADTSILLLEQSTLACAKLTATALSTHEGQGSSLRRSSQLGIC